MTTKDEGELTAMGLFRDGLDRDIAAKETGLRQKLESMKREIDRALDHLTKGYRVSSTGIVLHNGIGTDQDCVILNELYDRRNALTAAIEHDAKGGAK